MANYRRDPIYLIDRWGWLSLSFVFYEYALPPRILDRYAWGIRRLSWPVPDRWAIDLPWFSFFIEVWCLGRLLKWR